MQHCPHRSHETMMAEQRSRQRYETPKQILSFSPGNLMQSHQKRDPMKTFEVVSLLGEGSMGLVCSCRKRLSVLDRSSVRRLGNFRRVQTCCFRLPWPLNGLFFGARRSRDDSKFVVVNDGEGVVGAYLENSPGSTTPETSTVSSSSSLSSGRSLSPACSATDLDSVGPRPQNAVSSSLRHRGGGIGTRSERRKGKVYALKTIALVGRSSSSSAFRRELENEISILRGLDHPNVVKAFETYSHSDRLYLVLEMCSGGDLHSRFPYTERESAAIMKSLLSAVSYLHSKGIVHSDLKFENIMFASDRSPTAEVKIIDFGLSQRLAGDKQYLHDQVGTVYTMAPELIAGVNYNAKVDVWSLGVIAFMLLSESLPFSGESRDEIVSNILRCECDYSNRQWLVKSPHAKKFVERLLTYNPDDRPTARRALESKWLRTAAACGAADKDGPRALVCNSDGAAINARMTTATAAAEEAARCDRMDRIAAAMRRFADYRRLKKLALVVIAYQSSSDEVGFLRDVFCSFDSDHNGEIDLMELEAMLSQSRTGCPRLETEKVFYSMDVSGTGVVRYCEFLAATLEAHGRPMEEERLADAFDRIDMNGTGYITSDDLRAFLSGGGAEGGNTDVVIGCGSGNDDDRNIPQEYIDQIIDEADILCRDHRIDYDEFLSLFWTDEDYYYKDHENCFIPSGSCAGVGR